MRAEQGIANAQNDLGVCYYNGEGVEKDLAKSVEWYTKAAEKGIPNPQSPNNNYYILKYKIIKYN